MVAIYLQELLLNKIYHLAITNMYLVKELVNQVNFSTNNSQLNFLLSLNYYNNNNKFKLINILITIKRCIKIRHNKNKYLKNYSRISMIKIIKSINWRQILSETVR